MAGVLTYFPIIIIVAVGAALSARRRPPKIEQNSAPQVLGGAV
jgi:hypothetical protein